MLVQEIIAILLAVDTFADLLENRRIVLYSDNKGAEYTTAKGSARAADHNRMVHEIWTLALVKQIKLWIERVPTEDNIADLPSRFKWQLMYDIRATWREPTLPDVHICHV